MRKTLVAAVTALALVTSSTGCAWFKSETKVAKDAAIECAKQDLGQTVTIGGAVMTIAFAVVGIIFEGGTDWKTDLDKLTAKFGPEVVQCAAHIAQVLFTEPAGSGALSTGDLLDSPAARASTYTAGHTFK